MWDHQFDALAATHRAVRYDWRGYGESDDAVGPFARHEDVIGVMDALGIARAVLVRCGMGCTHTLPARYRCPTDRRGIYTDVSDSGLEVLRQARPTNEKALTDALRTAALDPELAPLVTAVVSVIAPADASAAVTAALGAS